MSTATLRILPKAIGPEQALAAEKPPQITELDLKILQGGVVLSFLGETPEDKAMRFRWNIMLRPDVTKPRYIEVATGAPESLDWDAKSAITFKVKEARAELAQLHERLRVSQHEAEKARESHSLLLDSVPSGKKKSGLRFIQDEAESSSHLEALVEAHSEIASDARRLEWLITNARSVNGVAKMPVYRPARVTVRMKFHSSIEPSDNEIAYLAHKVKSSERTVADPWKSVFKTVSAEFVREGKVPVEVTEAEASELRKHYKVYAGAKEKGKPLPRMTPAVEQTWLRWHMTVAWNAHPKLGKPQVPVPKGLGQATAEKRITGDTRKRKLALDQNDQIESLRIQLADLTAALLNKVEPATVVRPPKVKGGKGYRQSRSAFVEEQMSTLLRPNKLVQSWVEKYGLPVWEFQNFSEMEDAKAPFSNDIDRVAKELGCRIDPEIRIACLATSVHPKIRAIWGYQSVIEWDKDELFGESYTYFDFGQAPSVDSEDQCMPTEWLITYIPDQGCRLATVPFVLMHEARTAWKNFYAVVDQMGLGELKEEELVALSSLDAVRSCRHVGASLETYVANFKKDAEATRSLEKAMAEYPEGTPLEQQTDSYLEKRTKLFPDGAPPEGDQAGFVSYLFLGHMIVKMSNLSIEGRVFELSPDEVESELTYFTHVVRPQAEKAEADDESDAGVTQSDDADLPEAPRAEAPSDEPIHMDGNLWFPYYAHKDEMPPDGFGYIVTMLDGHPYVMEHPVKVPTKKVKTTDVDITGVEDMDTITVAVISFSDDQQRPEVKMPRSAPKDPQPDKAVGPSAPKGKKAPAAQTPKAEPKGKAKEPAAKQEPKPKAPKAKAEETPKKPAEYSDAYEVADSLRLKVTRPDIERCGGMDNHVKLIGEIHDYYKAGKKIPKDLSSGPPLLMKLKEKLRPDPLLGKNPLKAKGVPFTQTVTDEQLKRIKTALKISEEPVEWATLSAERRKEVTAQRRVPRWAVRAVAVDSANLEKLEAGTLTKENFSEVVKNHGTATSTSPPKGENKLPIGARWKALREKFRGVDLWSNPQTPAEKNFRKEFDLLEKEVGKGHKSLPRLKRRGKGGGGGNPTPNPTTSSSNASDPLAGMLAMANALGGIIRALNGGAPPRT